MSTPSSIARLIFCCFLLIPALKVEGQFLSDRLFVEGRLQTSVYSGDRGVSGSGVGLLFNSLGSGLAVATGYELSNSWEAVGELAFSSYPGINTNERGLRPIIASTSSTTKTSLLAELRYHFLPVGSYTPYLSSGLGIAWGTLNDNKEGGWGPLVGFGVRFPFKGFTPFVGLRFHYMYPNSAMDLAGSGSSPDVLTSLGTGLR